MQTGAERRDFLAPKELACELRVHVSSVYRAIERGSIPAVRLSEQGALRIPASVLEAERRP
jgi:excisionase family DNA binding protein